MASFNALFGKGSIDIYSYAFGLKNHMEPESEIEKTSITQYKARPDGSSFSNETKTSEVPIPKAVETKPSNSSKENFENKKIQVVSSKEDEEPNLSYHLMPKVNKFVEKGLFLNIPCQSLITQYLNDDLEEHLKKIPETEQQKEYENLLKRCTVSIELLKGKNIKVGDHSITIKQQKASELLKRHFELVEKKLVSNTPTIFKHLERPARIVLNSPINDMKEAAIIFCEIAARHENDSYINGQIQIVNLILKKEFNKETKSFAELICKKKPKGIHWFKISEQLKSDKNHPLALDFLLTGLTTGNASKFLDDSKALSILEGLIHDCPQESFYKCMDAYNALARCHINIESKNLELFKKCYSNLLDWAIKNVKNEFPSELKKRVVCFLCENGFKIPNFNMNEELSKVLSLSGSEISSTFTFEIIQKLHPLALQAGESEKQNPSKNDNQKSTIRDSLMKVVSCLFKNLIASDVKLEEIVPQMINTIVLMQNKFGFLTNPGILGLFIHFCEWYEWNNATNIKIEDLVSITINSAKNIPGLCSHFNNKIKNTDKTRSFFRKCIEAMKNEFISEDFQINMNILNNLLDLFRLSFSNNADWLSTGFNIFCTQKCTNLENQEGARKIKELLKESKQYWNSDPKRFWFHWYALDVYLPEAIVSCPKEDLSINSKREGLKFLVKTFSESERLEMSHSLFALIKHQLEFEGHLHEWMDCHMQIFSAFEKKEKHIKIFKPWQIWIENIPLKKIIALMPTQKHFNEFYKKFIDLHVSITGLEFDRAKDRNEKKEIIFHFFNAILKFKEHFKSDFNNETIKKFADLPRIMPFIDPSYKSLFVDSKSGSKFKVINRVETEAVESISLNPQKIFPAIHERPTKTKISNVSNQKFVDITLKDPLLKPTCLKVDDIAEERLYSDIPNSALINHYLNVDLEETIKKIPSANRQTWYEDLFGRCIQSLDELKGKNIKTGNISLTPKQHKTSKLLKKHFDLVDKSLVSNSFLVINLLEKPIKILLNSPIPDLNRAEEIFCHWLNQNESSLDKEIQIVNRILKKEPNKAKLSLAELVLNKKPNEVCWLEIGGHLFDPKGDRNTNLMALNFLSMGLKINRKSVFQKCELFLKKAANITFEFDTEVLHQYIDFCDALIFPAIDFNQITPRKKGASKRVNQAITSEGSSAVALGSILNGLRLSIKNMSEDLILKLINFSIRAQKEFDFCVEGHFLKEMVNFCEKKGWKEEQLKRKDLITLVINCARNIPQSCKFLKKSNEDQYSEQTLEFFRECLKEGLTLTDSEGLKLEVEAFNNFLHLFELTFTEDIDLLSAGLNIFRNNDVFLYSNQDSIKSLRELLQKTKDLWKTNLQQYWYHWYDLDVIFIEHVVYPPAIVVPDEIKRSALINLVKDYTSRNISWDDQRALIAIHKNHFEFTGHFDDLVMCYLDVFSAFKKDKGAYASNFVFFEKWVQDINWETFFKGMSKEKCDAFLGELIDLYQLLLKYKVESVNIKGDLISLTHKNKLLVNRKLLAFFFKSVGKIYTKNGFKINDEGDWSTYQKIAKSVRDLAHCPTIHCLFDAPLKELYKQLGESFVAMTNELEFQPFDKEFSIKYWEIK